VSARFSITLTLDEFVAANGLCLRRYWLWSGLLKLFAWSAASYFLLMLGVTAFTEPTFGRFVVEWVLQLSLGLGLFMVVFMPLVTWVAMRLSVKRQFEQLSLDLPVEYEIDTEGFRVANTEGAMRLTWDRLYDFVQDGRLLLLRRTRRIFFVLPKAQLGSEELETILAFLRGAGVRAG
jgi:hypothetical protein